MGVPVPRQILGPVVASIAILGSNPGNAPAQLVGGELRVNTYTTGEQRSARLASISPESFVVVWAGFDDSGSEHPIFGRLFDQEGRPLGPEFRVSSYTSAFHWGPAVASNSSGRFVVVWSSYEPSGPQEEVFGRIFESTGEPIGEDFQINTYTPGNQSWPAVGISASGEFVVVWSDDEQQDDDWGVFGRRFDEVGVPIVDEFPVSAQTSDMQQRPAVAADDDGGFVAVWQSYGQDGSKWGVFGRRFDSAGDPVGSDFQVNTYTTQSQSLPSVAVTEVGEFVVVWQSYQQDGSEWGIHGRRFDVTGAPVGSEFQVNSASLLSQYYPFLAIDEVGQFVVVWSGSYQPGADAHVFGQRFDGSGIPYGDEFRINADTLSSQSLPAVAAISAGRFAVAWDRLYQNESSFDVFERIVTMAVFSDGFEDGDAGRWSATAASASLP